MNAINRFSISAPVFTNLAMPLWSNVITGIYVSRTSYFKKQTVLFLEKTVWGEPIDVQMHLIDVK